MDLAPSSDNFLDGIPQVDDPPSSFEGRLHIRHDFPWEPPVFFPPRTDPLLDAPDSSMQKSSTIGLLAGIVLIVGAILFGTGWSKFLDPASLLVVLGGTTSAVVVSRSFDKLRAIVQGIQKIFTFDPPDLQRHVDQLSNLGRIARREGVLALDQRLDEVDNDLLRFGLELTVDGMEQEEIRDLLNQRIAERRKRRELTPEALTLAGTYAPAFGMVGTLIGLIQMLQNLEDPSKIGAGMATALVTTFYGAVLANLVFLPLSNRATAQNQMRKKIEYIVREGTLSIAGGESPRMIEQRLTHLIHEDSPAGEGPQTAQTEEGASEPQPAAAAA
jgi:chemotaxis protein MotA